MGVAGVVTVSELTRAINQKCLECCGGMHGEITRCRVKGCALHPYRPYQSETPRQRAGRKAQVSVFDVLEAAT